MLTFSQVRPGMVGDPRHPARGWLAAGMWR